MPSSSPSLRVASARAGLLGLACNLAGGALIAYVYGLGLVQLEPWGNAPFGSPRSLAQARDRLVFTMLLWAVIILLAQVAALRIDRRIAYWYERLRDGASPSEVPPDVRYHVLNRAVVVGAISLGFWALAGALFGLAFLGSLRVALTITGVAGILSVGLSVPLVDLAWRPIVPVFFPDGRLSAVRAVRLSVLTRLLFSLLLVGLYPTGLLAVSSLTGAADMVDAEQPARILRNLMALEGALIGVSVVTAMVMAFSITRSIVRPLNELQTAMDRVAAEDLTARVTVTTNDELGGLAERFNEMVAALRAGEVVRGLLNQYVSPEVARQAVESGAELGGQLAHCTVLFADMRDFTTLAERLSPEQLLALLNRFMGAMVTAVVGHGGLVNKFGGDSLLAVFGTPLNPSEDHAAAGVRAALDMRRALEGLNRTAAEDGEPALRLGIGLATGPVVVGNIGGRERIEYTVIGAAVNLAARLERLTRDAETDILLHEDTYTAASRTLTLDARALAPLDIRGLSDPVMAFALN